MELTIKMRVGFFDSGVGGITYFDAIRQSLKNLDTASFHPSTLEYKLFYFMDNEGFPYGNKSEDYLIERIIRLVQEFIKKCNLDIIVLACNTASLFVIDKLRALIPQQIVGVVPAIKTAVKLKIPRIYVMNTNAAGNSSYAKNMTEHSKEKYGYESKVFLHACQDLVNSIELMVCADEESKKNVYYAQTLEKLSILAKEINAYNCGAVVLGCTHFLHIKNELKSLLPKDIIIIDSIEGVTKQTIFLVFTLITQKFHSKKSIHLNKDDISMLGNKNFHMSKTNFENNIISYFHLNNDTEKRKYELVSKKYNMNFMGKL